MPLWMAVALGGALGSLARWQIGAWTRAAWPIFPWGTLLVNVSGGLAIGLVAAYAAARGLPEWLRLGLITGVLGGFTTFSAFSLETLELWRQSGAMALSNVAANLVLSLAACALGIWLGRAAFTA